MVKHTCEAAPRGLHEEMPVLTCILLLVAFDQCLTSFRPAIDQFDQFDQFDRRLNLIQEPASAESDRGDFPASTAAASFDQQSNLTSTGQI